jgi:hypothetical protein
MMRRLITSAALGAALAIAAASVAIAHDGGHAGGCEDFGQLNRDIGQDPGAYGFAWARNLGDIVSWFAGQDDGTPGVGDIVEAVDHASCG